MAPCNVDMCLVGMSFLGDFFGTAAWPKKRRHGENTYMQSSMLDVLTAEVK